MHTTVLVHGAFAESASWGRVAERLHANGHPIIAAANPLRGVAHDAAWLTDLVRTIDGPVVLVGHSYGGAVISNVAADAGDITALVYVAAFAPEPGENCIDLSQRFPGSTLGDALQPVPRQDGTVDLLIARDRFHAQFCADVPDLLHGQLGDRVIAALRARARAYDAAGVPRPGRVVSRDADRHAQPGRGYIDEPTRR
jgi:pimeloyl-ACP methyl ester carboxylesterase